MRRKWWPRSEPAPEPDPGRELVEECAAFLAGAYPALLARHGRGIPPWAWLNPVAHGSRTELRTLASGYQPVGEDNPAGHPGPNMTWAEAVGVLADELNGFEDPDQIQRDLLVPLELRLASGVVEVRAPKELVDTARAALDGPRAG